MSRQTPEMSRGRSEMSRKWGHFVTNQLEWELMVVTRHLTADQLWTVKTVGDALVWAVKLCAVVGGPAAPAGARAAWPEVFRHEDEIRMAESAGTGLVLRPTRLSQRDATRMEKAIQWQAKYLSGDRHEGARRVLTLWVRCMCSRRMKFSEAIRRRRWSKATAYRVRDKALLTIAIGLMKEGERPWQ